MSGPALDIQDIVKKWQFVFNFFNEHGAPDTASFRGAFNTLSFTEKISIRFNILAFVFGFIYFPVKGMIKSAVTIFLVDGVAAVIREFVPHYISFGVGTAAALAAGVTANYTYYRHVVLGEKDFNPFKSMAW